MQNNDSVKIQQQEQKQEKPANRISEASPILAQSARLLQSGAKLRDLSPEQAREVAAVIGNQAVLQLLHGGSPIKLAPAPPGARETEALPETAVDIRWPALTGPPKLIRDGPLPGGVFAVEHLREMGSSTAKGGAPDG